MGDLKFYTSMEEDIELIRAAAEDTERSLHSFSKLREQFKRAKEECPDNPEFVDYCETKCKDSFDETTSKVSNLKSKIIQKSREHGIEPHELCQDVVSKHAKYVTKRMERLLITAQSVDVCFVIDATGSMHMDSIFKGLKATIKSFTDLKLYNKFLKLRISVIAYRDNVDGPDRYTTLPFTENLQDFAQFVTNIQCSGGGDQCEDVIGGLNEAVKLNWECCAKLLFLCGDAPCHGREYHNGCQDNYPGGLGLSSSSVIEKLVKRKVVALFWKVNATTDKMIEKFNSEATEAGFQGDFFEVEKLDLSSIASISKTVSNSVMKSTMSSIAKSSAAAKKVDLGSVTKALSATGSYKVEASIHSRERWR